MTPCVQKPVLADRRSVICTKSQCCELGVSLREGSDRVELLGTGVLVVGTSPISLLLFSISVIAIGARLARRIVKVSIRFISTLIVAALLRLALVLILFALLLIVFALLSRVQTCILEC